MPYAGSFCIKSISCCEYPQDCMLSSGSIYLVLAALALPPRNDENSLVGVNIVPIFATPCWAETDSELNEVGAYARLLLVTENGLEVARYRSKTLPCWYPSFISATALSLVALRSETDKGLPASIYLAWWFCTAFCPVAEFSSLVAPMSVLANDCPASCPANISTPSPKAVKPTAVPAVFLLSRPESVM